MPPPSSFSSKQKQRVSLYFDSLYGKHGTIRGILKHYLIIHPVRTFFVEVANLRLRKDYQVEVFMYRRRYFWTNPIPSRRLPHTWKENFLLSANICYMSQAQISHVVVLFTLGKASRERFVVFHRARWAMMMISLNGIFCNVTWFTVERRGRSHTENLLYAFHERWNIKSIFPRFFLCNNTRVFWVRSVVKSLHNPHTRNKGINLCFKSSRKIHIRIVPDVPHL